MILKLFGLSIKAEKIKLKKKTKCLSDESKSTVERVPQIFIAFFCRCLTLYQSAMQVTVLKSITYRGVEYGLKATGSLSNITFSDAKQLLVGCREHLGKKIKSSTQKYRTPSKLQNEIKKNYCCFKK